MIDQNIKSSATIIFLTAKDYAHVIEAVCKLDLKGGIVYDAIVVECARKANAEQLLTLNIKDFERLLPDDAIKIISL